MPASIVLRAQDIGMLTTLGFAAVPVRIKLRKAIRSRGDELVPVDAQLVHGKAHDSNTYFLTALAQNAGCEGTAPGYNCRPL